MTPPSTSAQKESGKSESLFLNLLFNIILPTLVLTKLSGDEYLGTRLGIVVALTFPVAYGIKDFIAARKINFFSALGVVSVILTGGISLLELDPAYIAIKEAMVPAIFGVATLISLKTPYPLVKTFLYNDKILQTDKIANALEQNGNQKLFEKLLANASCLVAGSFFLSSLLNYLLATLLITSQPGTVEFNEQLGKMTALSFPVIALPAMLVLMAALFYLFRGVTRLTGLALEDVIHHHEKKGD
ncbi:MAG: MFS transporter [Gammaproteobacteria bacterium]|nr:MAG: MFS transporter [Gammaproteobacteria bacterium]